MIAISWLRQTSLDMTSLTQLGQRLEIRQLSASLKLYSLEIYIFDGG